MYTPVTVRGIGADEAFEGHVYDVGEGGVRFELDEPLPVGREVVVQMTLPGTGEPGPGRSIYAFGTVVWGGREPDEPGPVKMAAVFTGFASRMDRERLLDRIGAGAKQGGLKRVA
jgi:hypothetical protein